MNPNDDAYWGIEFGRLFAEYNERLGAKVMSIRDRALDVVTVTLSALACSFIGYMIGYTVPGWRGLALGFSVAFVLALTLFTSLFSTADRHYHMHFETRPASLHPGFTITNEMMKGDEKE